ncbi:Quinic acid utilization activator [Hyphodiscus hymeniophilus]|uniref:Quinic acid utilization activator n=1 Tax=Hyphodiscus hymeniophilus TaxID=353542 RepID=A0A9P7AUV6_9HELO|nr:Quinic acid utilization activator [Hyphodiscus hymeniophilus]
MSSYSGHSSYPHHPPPPQHPQVHQQSAQSNDPLSHHSLPISPQYQYDAQPPQQHQQPLYNNEHINGNGTQDQQNAPPGGPAEAQKGNRLRKACDSCSVRKVKCDEAGPPCKACAALEIPCTFNRPSRRRGPPNRHAEEVKEREKRRRLEGSLGDFSTPTSPNNIAATLVAFSSSSVLNAESICPIDTLKLLVDDFFTYIHPLAPFPHEPSFRAAFQHREDLSNPSFLALLASMIGVLVASFPRRPRLHLKNQQRQNMFPSSISLVERCHKIAVEARGPGYLDKELTVYDAVTSYFLGLAAAYTFQWKVCRLYFGETLNIMRVLGAHKAENPLYLGTGNVPTTFGANVAQFDQQGQSDGKDYIKQEIGRRVFWIMFVGIRSMQQLGATFGELLIPPPTPSEPYPPLPIEVDDEYIFEKRVEPQPEGIRSKLAGFNIGIRIYETLTPLATMEMAYGIDQVFDWNRQKKVLEDALRNVKNVLHSVPPELHLQPSTQSGQYEPTDRQYYPPMTDYPGVRTNGSDMSQWADAEARRSLQFEIQKANIYASQLGTRSYIVEKYWNLYEVYEQMKADNDGASQGSPGLMATGLDGILPGSLTSNYDGIETLVAGERESIVQDLLRVLGSISQVNMEPNSGSFINKIRQIASTLIETPRKRKGPLALKSEEYLGRFLDVLMKLERISPGNRNESADGVIDEEEELRNWADLREYQMRFAQSGGFLVD